ncbi:DNA polymerase I B chloroplastic/mitochondrial [Zea mays]|uniref:DNA polymerase I B chloroplastic/mitochondrial n=1 Tax=Zea mays TaxID=4577 RepID=A0A1D6FP38_MAIZE|nr:DNA polymerase I B chloroplastic/mitochondrial [Zea mays]
MLDAFIAGCDFHSRIAMNMYQHIRETVKEEKVILEWHPQPDQEKPSVLLLKIFVKEEKDTPKLWYSNRRKGTAADVAICAMLEIDRNTRLKELGWTLLMQVVYA